MVQHGSAQRKTHPQKAYAGNLHFICRTNRALILPVCPCLSQSGKKGLGHKERFSVHNYYSRSYLLDGEALIYAFFGYVYTLFIQWIVDFFLHIFQYATINSFL